MSATAASQDGVESWHCFASGPHYDQANLAFGALIGFDEHLVQPGSGFAWHGHRGVEIVSWVIAGTLHHEDSDGRVRIVEPGQALWQSTGSGIRHCEVNASASDSLRLVQMTLLGGGAAPTVRLAAPPARGRRRALRGVVRMAGRRTRRAGTSSSARAAGRSASTRSRRAIRSGGADGSSRSAAANS